MSPLRQRMYYSYPSRWGTGKVHKQYYNTTTKRWVCFGHALIPHGDTEDYYNGPLPVEPCKLCANVQPPVILPTGTRKENQ